MRRLAASGFLVWYVLLSSPKVLMNTDSDLEVGEFGIATRMVQPEPGQEPAELPEAPPAGATRVYKPQGPVTQAALPSRSWAAATSS